MSCFVFFFQTINTNLYFDRIVSIRVEYEPEYHLRNARTLRSGSSNEPFDQPFSASLSSLNMVYDTSIPMGNTLTRNLSLGNPA
jgi:hypothetical protein